MDSGNFWNLDIPQVKAVGRNFATELHEALKVFFLSCGLKDTGIGVVTEQLPHIFQQLLS